jgi:hypothetical protein
MATWSAFAEWVRPLVPGCPDPLLERALCDAAIEFCELTQAFVERARFTTRIGKASYEVVSEAGVPGMVLGVTLAGRVLPPAYLDALTNARGEAWQDDSGAPTHYLADFEDQVRVYPAPDKVESGHLTLAVRPSRKDTSWDDRLYERYGEIVADGALARLLAQAATPWAQPKLAQLRRQDFMRGVNKVRAKVMAAYTPATVYASI